MKALIFSRTTLAWVVLVAATLLSGALGGRDVEGTAVAIIVVALAKIAVILFEFMGLGRTPLVLRAIFVGWLTVVGGVMIVLYFGVF